MDKQEKIVCAAIQYSARDYKNGGFSEPKHICGVDYKFIEIPVAYTSPIRGFATSKNRFVDAKEAMRIAISQCQIYSVELLYRELNTHNASPRYDNWQLHHDQIKAGIALMESSLLARELKPEDLY